jgi:hypothetical protein
MGRGKALSMQRGSAFRKFLRFFKLESLFSVLPPPLEPRRASLNYLKKMETSRFVIKLGGILAGLLHLAGRHKFSICW